MSVSTRVEVLVKGVKAEGFTVSEVTTVLDKSVSYAYKALAEAIEGKYVKELDAKRIAGRGRPAKLFALTPKGLKMIVNVDVV